MTTSRTQANRSLASALVATMGLLVALVAGPAPATAGDAGPQAPKVTTAGNTYVVILDALPAAAYRGGLDGYLRTAVADRKYDSTSRAAIAYTGYLTRQQDRLAASVGARPYYHYTTALNGFAAELTPAEAKQLSGRPGVLAVVRDESRLADTSSSPQFLGLTGPTGVWRRLGGTDPVTGAGHGIIVGIIDSGIDDEAASFAPAGDGVPADWHGVCDPGTDANFACNDKLLGGRYFDEAADVIPEEFESPDDLAGHGSHVAATAAGYNGVEALINGVDYGSTSGMAPAAKVAAYKACWQLPDFSNCAATVSDSVAAIDAAVADGVDVLNYSISGTADDVVDPVELAFMYAADAGVFVAAAGGNEGPTGATVRHPSPWLTTVAAATHRKDESTVLLGDSTRMVGASLSPIGVDESPLVYARSIPADGVDADDAAFCLSETLDTSEAAGAIVICDRGVNLRVEKGDNVEAAGGVGMVLLNVDPVGVETDVQAVPTVNLSKHFRAVLLAYAATAAPTASILAGVDDGSLKPDPPAIAFFSSRGPSQAAGGDILKPDIASPGFNVIAATSPESVYGSGNSFGVISGTSMASPHIAGLAALVIQRHPDWSPMAVKSAIMTTARDLTNTTNPFFGGAGFVQPREFLDPGLVYDSDFDDWSDYLAGQGVGGFSTTPTAASDLNVASIAVNELTSHETVVRTVTNVDDTTATYRAAVEGLAGLKVRVKPAALTLQPGRTGSFSVTVGRGTAKIGRWASGALVWRDGSHVVRAPMVVRPVLARVPAEVTVGDRATRLLTTAGFDGTMGHVVDGLVAPVVRSGVANDSGEAGDPLSEANYFRHVKVTGPRQAVRVATSPEFATDDLDLYLLDQFGSVIASSNSDSGEELVTMTGLPSGLYFIAVEAFDLDPDRSSTTFTLRVWKTSGQDAGNVTVTPGRQRVVAGGSVRWRARAAGLDPSESYFGVIRWTRVHGDGSSPVATTLVTTE